MDPFPSTLAGSSKRGRTPSTGAQPVSCLVDGCNSDLSKCRDYHRRHKVCEMHSKTPRVTIAGHQQRFCQQCSRFHSLGEFDEGKRSCRKRLEGHNRRRRKPQPVNHANFPSSIQGSRFFPLSNQPMIPTASSVVSKNVSNHDTNTAGFFSSSPISDSYLHPYRSTRQFSFTGSSSPAQMFHNDHNSVPGNGSNNNGRFQLLYDGTSNQGIDAVSNRALSLLSSSPADTWEMGLGRSIHNPSLVNPTRPMISGLQYLDPQHQGLEGPPGNSGLIPSNNSLCQNVFTGEADGSSCSSGGGHQTLSFSWG